MTNSEKYKTTRERNTAFNRICNKCDKNCTVYNRKEYYYGDIRCEFVWLDMEVEEDTPMPCPLCGG